MSQKLISIDLKANFAFFKKPDYNDGLLLSYNMLHKPALLGVLGAIIGLQGYQKKGELPAYYTRLKSLLINIEPIGSEKGNFQKVSVKYTNTVGYANQDGTLLIEETMLLKPCYRCYLLLDEEQPEHFKLYEYLKEGKAEFIPYLGKNEYQAWWLDEFTGENSFREYPVEEVNPTENFKLKGMFTGEKITPVLENSLDELEYITPYFYFERLPVDFIEKPFIQYNLGDFKHTNAQLSSTYTIGGRLFKIKHDHYIQLY
ncbi:CRISPR-associated protein Cas5 [Mucilaginibacter paludis]|uniref:CRISPR-associated protein Cas5 n=1 Tax=Mucilaginibacter paludis DSM 18603 TaxID=714943 RepID=H1YB53_9SPHI|nr:CRISPR-associated protein Cas5 [Mucilaginibacter paludis]EHQ30579.1 CRISPR-associated protein Cas5 [Mucilaginibacter paludis DSM 18603]